MIDYLLNNIEYIGVAFGILCVILTAIENIWCWPTGIISVLAYLIFYYQLNLYLSAYLQIIYLIACVMGWYQWLYTGANKKKLTVTTTTKKHLWEIIPITFSAFLILGALSDWYSDDQMPYIDALLASMSVAAQWMMNKKLLENWLVWLVTDLAYTIMHFYMHNYASGAMYGIFVVFVFIGYYLWKQSMKQSREAL